MSPPSVRARLLPLVALLSLAGAAGAAAPARSHKTAATRPRVPEAVEMILSLLLGKGAGPGAGWYHPSQTRYDWKWLAGRLDVNRDGVITRQEFRGPTALFDRLDRDGDGRLTPADLDWSPRSPLVRQEQQAAMLFRRADADGNGRLSRAEWQALFKQAARGKDHLTADDLRALLSPPRRPARGAASGMPSRWTLLKAVLRGEIGSLQEGPDLGEVAPSFRLPTHDGKRTISLADYRGKRPVVLIFGSFT